MVTKHFVWIQPGLVAFQNVLRGLRGQVQSHGSLELKEPQRWSMASMVVQMVKNMPAMQETRL